MFTTIRVGFTDTGTVLINNTTTTTSTIDWDNGSYQQTHYIETEIVPRKKKKIPVEPWRSKRKGGKGIR